MRKIFFALLLMGFTSLTVQTLLIREFLITFYGNELTIGIILANWIILEALGSSILSPSSLKSKRPYLAYALLQIGISLYLPLSIFLIRSVKNTLGLTLGEGIGIIPVLFSSFFILAPLSFFDGGQFPFGCRLFMDATKKPLESAGKVYILEAMGFILAGPLFTYILITKLNSFSIAFFLGLINLFSAILLLKKRADTLSRTFLILANILFIFALLAFFGPTQVLQKSSIDEQWRGQKVLSYQNSIYGNLAVTESGNQYTFYSDGIPIITTPVPDITHIEELVHFSMLSHPNPKNVLLLSGGAGGVIKEVLKYPVEKLTYTELDPLLIKLIKETPTELTQEELSDPRLNIQYIDGRRYLRLTKSQYDVVILNLPMPSTLQLNRFYTQEFFKNVRSILSKDGVFTFSLPGSLSYISQSMRNLNGSILNTLESVFYVNPALSTTKRHDEVRKSGVNIIPGDFNLYIASNKDFAIGPEIFLKRLQDFDISTQLLNEFHLQYRLHPRWLNWFSKSLSDYTHFRKNFDLLPSGTFYSLWYWNSIFSPRLEGIFRILDKLSFKVIVSIFSLLAFSLFMLRKAVKLKRLSIAFAIGSTGFVGLSFDLILIYAYQSFYGFVFSHLALLVTAFMAGLTLGGWMMTRRLERIRNDFLTFSKIELAICGFCLAAGPLLLYLGYLGSLKFSFLFFILSCVSGYLVGSEFPLANKIYPALSTTKRHNGVRKGGVYTPDKSPTKTAGLLYALDLLGAWLAALVISAALVPVIGILMTCILLLILKVISLALVASTR